jgi:hypothetical protein
MRLRQVAVVHGFPILPHALRLGPGTRLVPFDSFAGYGTLWKLVNVERQRDPRRWTHANGLFVVQDTAAPKRDDPKDLDTAFDRLHAEYVNLLSALRLAYAGNVYVSRRYRVHISPFPLLPAYRQDNPEDPDLSLISNRTVTARELGDFREALALLRRQDRPKERPRFLNALERFNRGFRYHDPVANIVDLVVALEGLFDVQQEELRFRLALRVALILGDGMLESKTVYDHVTAAYNIRNQLVHGRASRSEMERNLRKWMAQIALQSAGHTSLPEDALAAQAVTRIRHHTRRALWAYARLQGFGGGAQRWPQETQQWDALVFDPKECRALRRSAGRSMRGARP